MKPRLVNWFPVLCITIVGVLGLVFCVVAGGCRKTPDLSDQDGIRREKGSSDNPRPAPVTEQVKEHVFRRTVSLQANLVPNRTVQISAKVQGILERVHHREGDWVEEGEVLFQLERDEMDRLNRQAEGALVAAHAAVEQARVGMEQAASRRDRLRRLRDQDVVTSAQMEEVVAAWDVAVAAHRMAKAQEEVAQAALEDAQAARANTVVRAPMAGHVAARLMDEGEFVRAMPPSVVMVLVETDPVLVEAALPERDLALAKVGARVDVELDAFPDKRISSTLVRMASTLNPATRTVRLVGEIPNSDRRLLPGMAARVRLHGEEETLPGLPREAVFSRDSSGRGVEVLILEERNASGDQQAQGLIRRRVTLASADLGTSGLMAVADGLLAGDLVVVEGHSALLDQVLPAARVGSLHPAAESREPGVAPGEEASGAEGARPSTGSTAP